MFDTFLQYPNQIFVHIAVIIGNIQYDDFFVPQSAGELCRQAAFVLLLHDKNLIRPCDVSSGNSTPRIGACACGTGLDIRVTAKHKLRSGAARLVAAANKKCVYRN